MDSEKQRIEEAGSSVRVVNGIHRVAGMLAVSRAIGDKPYKKLGVTAMPETYEYEL